MNDLRRLVFDLAVWTVSILAGAVLIVHEAQASERLDVSGPASWKAECGSCHIAYPPQLLPASAWRQVMAGLGRHFGTDASLDAKAAAEIGAFLENNAGTGKRGRGAENNLRITTTRWFVRQHDELPDNVWTRPSIGGASRCDACHAGAAQGDFNEHRVRIPR